MSKASHRSRATILDRGAGYAGVWWRHFSLPENYRRIILAVTRGRGSEYWDIRGMWLETRAVEANNVYIPMDGLTRESIENKALRTSVLKEFYAFVDDFEESP